MDEGGDTDVMFHFCLPYCSKTDSFFVIAWSCPLK